MLAEQGDAEAQFNVGHRSQDDADAVRWYRLAADQGHAAAQGRLGFMYAIGPDQEVPQDYVEAHMWLSLAAAQSSDEAFVFVEVRDNLAERMSPEQLAEAKRRARERTPTPEP